MFRTVAVLLISTLMPLKILSQTVEKPAVRHVIICVDGVGFSTISKMHANGHFKLFRPPSHMISTFPSLTNAALSRILEPAGATMTGGYEDNFFDTEANKMRGGILDRFRSDRFVRGTFRELFDYHPSALKSGLGYTAPPVSTYLESLSDLIRLRQKARNNRGAVFFAYTGATDSLAHLGGETLLRSFLEELDETIEDIVRDSKTPVAVTIFSDHGNHFRNYRRVALKDPLRRAGFNLSSKIKDDKSVVLPQFGLVGSAVLFTKDTNEEHLAEVLATLEGVDFVTYEQNGIVHVANRRGAATIEQRDNAYRYSAIKGDPLDLLSLTQHQQNGHEGFIKDEDWFVLTRAGVRPDVVRRIFEGATQGVLNRANVIVNLEDGYYTGSSLLDTLTLLQATHGNIGQEQSYGFVMSTTRELPTYIRAADVWDVLGPLELRRQPARKKN
ncbi:MAG TPA: hypothetical protein VFH46_13020 [Pyrinomonadaceae bacterium]|nr:hypothetical protein [Pyrinomonadaceae bacterium]